MKAIIAGCVFSILCACSSKPQADSPNNRKTQYNEWYSEIRHQLDPVLKKKLKSIAPAFEAKYHRAIRNSDHPLKLAIFVNPEGQVQDVKIVEASGIEEIDQLGVEAFQEISPLPKPPAAVLKDQEAKIRWDLILTD